MRKDKMAQADVRFVEINVDGSKVETMVELQGGFMGLEQNATNYALTPKIGWIVKKKIDEDAENLARMKKDLRDEHWIHLVIKEIPSVLREIDTIPGLDLRFRDSVCFPDWMRHKQIGHLRVRGKISLEERNKLLCWYPSTLLVVNDASYTRENGAVNVNISIYENMNVGSALDGIDHIGILHIDNEESKGFYLTGKILDVVNPETVTRKIDKIYLKKPSRKCRKALKEQFPNTAIIITPKY